MNEPKRLGDQQKPVQFQQIINNLALIAQSAVVGALRHMLIEKKVCTDAEIDEFIRGTIRMAPMSDEVKRQVMFLALGPGSDVREGIGSA